MLDPGDSILTTTFSEHDTEEHVGVKEFFAFDESEYREGFLIAQSSIAEGFRREAGLVVGTFSESIFTRRLCAGRPR